MHEWLRWSGQAQRRSAPTQTRTTQTAAPTHRTRPNVALHAAQTTCKDGGKPTRCAGRSHRMACVGARDLNAHIRPHVVTASHHCASPPHTERDGVQRLPLPRLLCVQDGSCTCGFAPRAAPHSSSARDTRQAPHRAPHLTAQAAPPTMQCVHRARCRVMAPSPRAGRGMRSAPRTAVRARWRTHTREHPSAAHAPQRTRCVQTSLPARGKRLHVGGSRAVLLRARARAPPPSTGCTHNHAPNSTVRGSMLPVGWPPCGLGGCALGAGMPMCMATAAQWGHTRRGRMRRWTAPAPGLAPRTLQQAAARALSAWTTLCPGAFEKQTGCH